MPRGPSEASFWRGVRGSSWTPPAPWSMLAPSLTLLRLQRGPRGPPGPLLDAFRAVFSRQNSSGARLRHSIERGENFLDTRCKTLSDHAVGSASFRGPSWEPLRHVLHRLGGVLDHLGGLRGR
eukprot:882731-Pyramimonas_sp.AAC.1